MGLFKRKSETVVTQVKCVYFSGLPSNFVVKNIFYLILDEEAGILQFKKSLEDSESVNLSLSKIVSVKTIAEDEIIKEKNGVGRAVAGGLLFGSAGAVIGAVTAKDKKKKVYYDTITYVSDKEEKTIIFKYADINCLKFNNHLREIVEQNKPQVTTVEL